MDISAVIISFNSSSFLPKNLNSLINQTTPFKEIIVVDNHSTDDSTGVIASFQAACPGLRLIALDQNTGYAEGANIGIRNTTSQLILVANADIYLAEDFNTEVTDQFTKDETLGLLSPLILRFDGMTVDSAGQDYSRALHPSEIGYNRPLSELKQTAGPVFSVCGAATVFHRNALLTLKQDNDYYDSDFFMFWEDFDIGWRANLLNLNTRFWPKAIVYHFRSATLKKNFFSRFSLALARPQEIKYHLVKNRFLTLIKNFRFKQFYWAIPFIIFKDFLWVGMLTIGSPKLIIRLLRELALFKKALAKRRELKKRVEERETKRVKEDGV